MPSDKHNSITAKATGLPYRKKEMALRDSVINCRLKSEVSITLLRQLCSTCYTALQIKNCSKSTSAIKVATMKNMDNFCFEGKPSCATLYHQIDTFRC